MHGENSEQLRRNLATLVRACASKHAGRTLKTVTDLFTDEDDMRGPSRSGRERERERCERRSEQENMERC